MLQEKIKECGNENQKLKFENQKMKSRLDELEKNYAKFIEDHKHVLVRHATEVFIFEVMHYICYDLNEKECVVDKEFWPKNHKGFQEFIDNLAGNDAAMERYEEMDTFFQNEGRNLFSACPFFKKTIFHPNKSEYLSEESLATACDSHSRVDYKAV